MTAHTASIDAENARIALVGIIVQNPESVERLNAILHEYREGIIGRMGIPCPDAGLSVISIAMRTTSERINALAGKIGALDGVSTKTVYPKTE